MNQAPAKSKMESIVELKERLHMTSKTEGDSNSCGGATRTFAYYVDVLILLLKLRTKKVSRKKVTT